MDHPKYLGEDRTIFVLEDKNIHYGKHIFGFIVFVVLFVIGVPYILISYGYWELLSAYFPNLDMIATIIGYHGGPMDSFIWTHLYNPADSTITGYLTSNLINLFALLGVAFVLIHFTFKSKSMFSPAARASIMLPMTYFIPGNLIVYLMNKFGKYLNRFFLSKSIQHYLIVSLAGFMVATSFIVAEAVLIKYYVPIISKIMEKLYNQVV
jgi:hypothetical protein